MIPRVPQWHQFPLLLGLLPATAAWQCPPSGTLDCSTPTPLVLRGPTATALLQNCVYRGCPTVLVSEGAVLRMENVTFVGSVPVQHDGNILLYVWAYIVGILGILSSVWAYCEV